MRRLRGRVSRVMAAVLLGGRDDVAAGGGGRGGRGEHRGRGDDADLRHPDAVAVDVPVVRLVPTRRHPLVGVY